MSTPVLPSPAAPAPLHASCDDGAVSYTVIIALPFNRPLTSAEKRRLEETVVNAVDALLQRWTESDDRLSRWRAS